MAAPRPSRHVWEIDVIRLLTFTAVISVHSIAFTQKPSNEVAAGFLMLLQFGREVFLCITGFVLVYSTLGKVVRPVAFWRRRIPYVAVPYLVWSVVYYGVGLATAGGSWSWPTFGRELIYGGAEYHLYFLVITLQLYVVFPYLVRFLRATSSRAVPVLVIVGVLNLTWDGLQHYVSATGWLWSRSYELLPTYSIYVVAGGYAALHWQAVNRYLVSHVRGLLLAAGGAALLSLGLYAYQLGWMVPRSAAAVVQPAMFASCVAALLVLAVVGSRWVAHGRPAQRAVAIASDISFGVYLAHPLVLTLLLDHGLGSGHQVIPSPLATVSGIIGAIAGASLLALAVRRTPLALPLIGRPRERRAPPVAALTEVSGDGNSPLMLQR